MNNKTIYLIYSLIALLIVGVIVVNLLFLFWTSQKKEIILICCDPPNCTPNKVCVATYYTKFIIYFSVISQLLLLGNIIFLTFAMTEKKFSAKMLRLDLIFICLIFLLSVILNIVWLALTRNSFKVMCQKCPSYLPKILIGTSIVLNIFLTVGILTTIFMVSKK